MGTRIPGPGRLETLWGLAPNPFPRFTPFLIEMTARYGHVIAFALPWRRYVFVNEPALIKDVLVTQQHAFRKSLGTRTLRMLLGEGLLTSEDPLHKQMRRIVQPAFHRARVAAYARVMETDAREFALGLRPGETFDVHAAMTALTLRIATKTLFGSDESGSTAIVSDALRLMMEEFPQMLTPLGRLAAQLPLGARRRFDRARERLDDVIYGLIARRRRDGGRTEDALSMLLDAADADTGCRPSDEQIRDEVMTLFMAGHETTANLLTWTFYLLARNAQVDERLGEAAKADDRGYVMRVVHETLRLYPPAWLIGREALHDVTLADGSFVAGGTTVFISPKLLHVRPDYFTDPLRFDPDRWLGSEPAPFAYVPFGGGARRCIGEEFAWHEAAIVLQTVARTHRFVMEPGVEVEPLASVTLRPQGPVPMRALPRAAAQRSSELLSQT
jgi:cytochrome P450